MGAAECIDQGTQRGKILRIHVIKLDADVGAVHSYQQAVATKRRLAVEFQGHGVMRARIQIDAAIVFEQRAVEGQVQDAATRPWRRMPFAIGGGDASTAHT